MGVEDIVRDFFVEQRSVRVQGALVPVFVAVCREEIGAIGRAIDGDLAFGAAADGADFLALSGAEALCFALFTNRTGRGISSVSKDSPAEYRWDWEKTKRCGPARGLVDQRIRLPGRGQLAGSQPYIPAYQE